MQLIIRILLGLFTILIGYNTLKSVNYYEEGFLSPPEILIIIPGIIALLLDAVNYRKTRRLYQFSTSFAWLVIYMVFGYSLYDNHVTDKAPTVLTVVNMPGNHDASEFEFKQNNRLKITQYDMLGSDIYYCHYQKNGDTLIIRNIPDGAETTRLPTMGIIRNDTVFWNNQDTMLVDRQYHAQNPY